MTYSSAQIIKLQTWLDQQEERACPSLAYWGFQQPLTQIKKRIDASLNAYQQQPWYRRWWQWWTRPVSSLWVLRLVYEVRERIAAARNGDELSEYLRDVAKFYSWSWWCRRYLGYQASMIEQEWQMNKAGAQANSPLSAKEALVKLIRDARWAMGPKEQSFELKSVEFETEINYDQRFMLAEKILQQEKARGWLGRDKNKYREERRKLYASLMVSLLEKLLMSCEHEEALPEVPQQLTLLGRLLEESLLLSNKDKIPILGAKRTWVSCQNLAGGLIQWAQKARKELANTDHPPFINEWLEVADQLRQGWEFEKKPDRGCQAIPKPENRWLVIEKKANDFKRQLRELKQVKKIDAKKSGNQLNGEVKELKTLIYLKLFSARTIAAAEKLCEKITMGLQELAGERKQLIPQPEAEFLLTSEAVEEACRILGLNPKRPLTITQIKKAYHDKAIECHPDKVKLTGLTEEVATERFQALNSAMETVIEELKKSQQPAVEVASWEELHDFLERELTKSRQNAERCKQLAQEQEQLERQQEQQKQQFEQRLEQQGQRFKQQQNLVLTLLRGMASPEQLEQIEQVTQKFAEQESESVEPPESTATSSASVQSPQTKGASKQWYTSSSSMWSTPADTHWYTHEEIQQLLQQQDLATEEVDVFTPMLATAVDQKLEISAREALEANLRDFLQNRQSSKVIIPLNLNNQHWTLIYLQFEAQNRATFYYFDPFGHEMPEAIANILEAFSIASRVTIVNLPMPLQTDGYNCGPWIVVAARSLVHNGELPEAGFDIHQARREQQQLLQQWQAAEGNSVGINRV
jgi:curved DNA-binding protein CbpA